MYQYPYTKQENSSSIPIITITLKNIDNYNLIVSNCDGILDTGADYTLIPVSLLSKLQISPIGKIKYLQGIGNNKIGVIPFRIAFNFYSEKFINVKVFGSKIINY